MTPDRPVGQVRQTGRAWPVPTGRLVAVAVVIGVAVLPLGETAGQVWVLANLALIVLAILDGVRCTSPRLIAIEREVDRIHTLDTVSTLTWAVSSRARRPVHVAVADDLPPSLRADRRRFTVRLPAGGLVRRDATFRPARRGTIDLTTVTLRVRGPLGLMSRQADQHAPLSLRVHPRFPSRDAAELKLAQARRLTEGLRTVRLRGQGTEFDALREYTPDDETRRIDWAATARARRPIVRTYRAERNQHILILLDHGRTMAGRMGRRPPSNLAAQPDDVEASPRLEHAMDAAMALTRVATGLGDRVGVVTFADQVSATVPPRTGLAQLTRVVEALADVPALLVEPDYRGAFAEALVRFRRRALVVVLTDLAEGPALESLRPALPLLLRRHIVLIASPTDPAVATWATSAPTDAVAAYRMSAATQAVADRRQTARLLSAGGAIAIDESPETLPLRLIDAYLDLKSTGRL